MTTKHETVTLSAEVAAALESALAARDGDKEALLRSHANPYPWENSALNDIDVLTLAGALINGYQVEKSPEEKLREYFEGLMRAEDTAESCGKDGGQFRQGWFSVKDTLSILGITIEGINA